MVNDGLMERFGIGEVYGMHNTRACRWVLWRPAGTDDGIGRCPDNRY